MQVYSPLFCTRLHARKSWLIWPILVSSFHHWVSGWAWKMGENVYYPGTFPWEGGVPPQVGRIPQPKVTASARWSSPTTDPHLAPIPASFLLSFLLPVQDGKSHPHHYSWEIPHLWWLHLYPVPTFINSLFIKLSSNYPISVGHLFSARIASHKEGKGWGLWLHLDQML